MKKQKKFLVQLLVFLTIILSSCQSFAVNISDYIGEIANKIRNSNKMNIAKWPISSRVNGDETMTFDESIARLKKSFTDKLSWLDQQIQNM